MSGESSAHVKLVEKLIEHVKAVHRPERGLLLLADHDAFSFNRPRSIGGYVPDLFASDLPVTFEVIGEAKTWDDLQTPRSARQISAFLDYLSVRPGSTFYLFVPPFTRLASQNVLRRLMREPHEQVAIEVIDGI